MKQKTKQVKTNGFDTVVEGTSNKNAVAAAKRVAAGPVDDILNPLVLVGPSGCGKTRILNAIVAEIKSMQDGRMMISTTGQRILDDYISAIEKGDVSHLFRDKFKSADVLIIDGTEAFETKQTILDEVLGIVDELIANGRQVVIVFSKPLKTIKKTNEKLYGRIASSATIKLDYPDGAMKRRYIKFYLAARNATLPDSTINDILNSSAKSFWEIKGAVCTAICEDIIRKEGK